MKIERERDVVESLSVTKLLLITWVAGVLGCGKVRIQKSQNLLKLYPLNTIF